MDGDTTIEACTLACKYGLYIGRVVPCKRAEVRASHGLTLTLVCVESARLSDGDEGGAVRRVCELVHTCVSASCLFPPPPPFTPPHLVVCRSDGRVGFEKSPFTGGLHFSNGTSLLPRIVHLVLEVRRNSPVWKRSMVGSLERLVPLTA